GAHDLDDRDLALAGDRDRLLDPVVHLEARREVEGRAGDLRAQRLDDRVAPGHELRVAVLLRGAAAGGGGLRPGAVALARGLEPLLRRLALAGDVPAAVLGLRGRPLAF